MAGSSSNAGPGDGTRTTACVHDSHKGHAVLEGSSRAPRLSESDTDTRYIRLRPGTQAIAYSGALLIVAWAIVASAILMMDSIGAGNFREQAKRDQLIYQDRLNVMSAERNARAEERWPPRPGQRALEPDLGHAVGAARLRDPAARARDRSR